MNIRKVWSENRPPRRSSSGPRIQNKGTLSLYRDIKREEAEERNAAYRARLEKVMADHNIGENDAKAVLAGTKKVENRKKNRK